MIRGENYTVHIGNNLDILPTLPDCSVDSIVTDPPYELGFMGKKWDSSGIAYNIDLWRECLRVLKPGGHLLSFGGTRTWHRVAVAIEDAGFEVRDSIAWMYGSGFPKSLDISKAIDKAAGVEREKIRVEASEVRNPKASGGGRDGTVGATRPWIEKALELGYHEKDSNTPATPEAQQWDGWGTALKPAFEPIVVARKPLIGTVAENVLTYGTGGLNIDGSRIGTGEGVVTFDRTKRKEQGNTYDLGSVTGVKESNQGRWPANVILDEYSAELLDEQSGVSKSSKPNPAISYGSGQITNGNSIYSKGLANDVPNVAPYGDTGGASRFFYVAKASKHDRNEGLEELDPQRHSDRQKDDGVGGDNPRNRTNQARQNFHPTVKPTDLMRYLIKLVTPPNGIVLDPFTGSGSTGKAAILEGFRFIGIEMTEDYIPIIEGRLKHAEDQRGLF
jgi:site-specific DNA-methyltransferase (adenine-specific)